MNPVFFVSGYDLTFFGIPLSEKNRVSHRAKAMRKLIGFLSDQKQTGAGK